MSALQYRSRALLLLIQACDEIQIRRACMVGGPLLGSVMSRSKVQRHYIATKISGT